MLAKQKLKEWRAEYVKTVRGRALKLINNARARSKNKNIECFLELDWLVPKLEKGVCEITNMPFNFDAPVGETRRVDAPSLDRIDKSKNYTHENTRVVLWAVNGALNEYGTDIMLPILEAMVKGIKNAEQKESTSVPTQHTGASQDNSQLGVVHGARVGENCDGAHHHRGEPEGQDPRDSSEEGCRICMGSGVRKMATLETFYGGQDNGDALCTAEEFAKRIRCLCYQP